MSTFMLRHRIANTVCDKLDNVPTDIPFREQCDKRFEIGEQHNRVMQHIESTNALYNVRRSLWKDTDSFFHHHRTHLMEA